MKNLILIFLSTFFYAFLRYNIFGNIPYADIPLVIVNKSIAFTIVVWFMLTIIKYIKSQKAEFQKYFSIFKSMVSVHVFLSILILSQDMLPKFLSGNSFTLFAGISLLAGVLATASMSYFGNKPSILILLGLLKIHLFFMGFNGWIHIDSWNGSMPPITLICFILVLLIDYKIITSTISFNK